MHNFIAQHWRLLAAPGVVFVLVFASGWIVRKILFRTLSAWAKRTAAGWDDVAVSALRRPFLLWMLMLALHLAVQSSELPPRIMALAARALLVLWIASLTLAAARLAAEIVRVFGARSSILPVTTLTQNLVRLVVAAVGLMVILDALDISIAPMLAALGVGGLAVALALKDTLSNLFSGFYLGLEGRIRVGDWIRLDSGEEGCIMDIDWRTTTLRTLANNLIIVPNSRLAQATVTNFNLPEPRMSIRVAVSAPFDSDPDRIERILQEEAAAAAAEVPGLLADPPPIARFSPGFGPHALEFTLICHVSEFAGQFLVQHELRKRILRRFRLEGIEFPYPARMVRIQEESAGPGGR